MQGDARHSGVLTPRPPRASALLLALALLLPVTGGVASAQPSGPTIDGPSVVAASPDFATEEFGDPWDFSNPEDVQTDNEGPVLPASARASLGGGRLLVDAPEGFLIALVWAGISGTIPVGREGQLHPVAAGRYTHAAVRVRAPSKDIPLGVLFHNCPSGAASCAGDEGGFTVPGWQTFIIDLSRDPEWAGSIESLRLQTGLPAGDERFEVDWVRLYAPTDGVTILADNGAEVFWDLDADPSNNTAEERNWGSVGTATGGKVTFPADAYPPGKYRLYITSGGNVTYGDTLVIDAPPLTVIDDPDITGGADYITDLTGDPWDMSQPGDARALEGVQAVSWSGGQLHATNSGNNPIVKLRMAPVPIDPVRYHRLTVTTTYDGPFSLSFQCGGGMHGRLRWWHGGEQHVSAEMALYSDRSTYTYDLHTDPPAAINDAHDYPNSHGWRGDAVTDLWWDANEDPCPRRWRLDDVALRADDEAKGYFGIRWHDDAHDGETTVNLYRDRDRSGFDGSTVAAGLTQRPGENVYWWPTYGVPAGTWWLWAEATDARQTVRRYATGPVVTDGRPRVAGPDRIRTAIAASRLSFQTADAAVVADAFGFPDALSGTAVAAAAGGPMLLNPKDGLDRDVATELRRLGVSTVYLMGGVAAQSAEVETGLAGLGDVEVIRFAGADRYDTAAQAAAEAVRLWQASGDGAAGSDVLLAVGTDFPDALAAGQLAGHDQRPLLLTLRDELWPATAAALDELEAERVTLIGGPEALGSGVEQALTRRGYRVERIGGDDRYATAVLVARTAAKTGGDERVVTVASGLTFADALSAGPAVVADGGVLLLTDPGRLPAVTGNQLERASPVTQLKVAGGPAAVSDAVVDAIVATS